MSQVTIDFQKGKILPQNQEIALVALGSNQPSGDATPADIVHSAIEKLGAEAGLIRAKSKTFVTPCWPAGFGPDYANAVVALDWQDTAEALLDRLHRIEAGYGRERRDRWGSRTLDLDLLALGDRILPDSETLRHWVELPEAAQRENTPAGLVLPHPRLQDRAFVLVPLMEVAPDWVHPLTGNSVRTMYARLPETAVKDVIPLVNLAEGA